MFRSRFTKTAVTMLAAAVTVTALIGCGDDGEEESSSGGGLATEMGWEWVSCEWDEYDDEEWCDVIMFRPNGEMWVFEYVYDDYWVETKEGEWAELSGDRLRITRVYSDNIMNLDYTLSDNGNTLTLMPPDGYVGEPVVYTKRRSHRPNGGGGNLVLSAGQAWTYSDYWDDIHDGIIFRSNGTFQFLEGFLGLIWWIDDDDEEGGGTYSTSSGGILNITFDGIDYRMNYTVSGNTLIFGDDEYERTSDVVIFDGDNDALMVLCLSLVASGAVPSLETCMEIGDIIFNKRAEEVEPGKHPILRRPQPLHALSKR